MSASSATTSPTDSLAKLFNAARMGDARIVGAMLTENPAYVYAADPSGYKQDHPSHMAAYDARGYMLCQGETCELAQAAKPTNKTLARAISILYETGTWNPSGQWPVAHVEVMVPAAKATPKPWPELVPTPTQQSQRPIEDPRRLLAGAVTNLEIAA